LIDQRLAAAEIFATQLGDHITLPQPGLFRWATGMNLVNPDAIIGLRQPHADVGPVEVLLSLTLSPRLSTLLELLSPWLELLLRVALLKLRLVLLRIRLLLEPLLVRLLELLLRLLELLLVWLLELLLVRLLELLLGSRQLLLPGLQPLSCCVAEALTADRAAGGLLNPALHRPAQSWLDLSSKLSSGLTAHLTAKYARLSICQSRRQGQGRAEPRNLASPA
jgi:hypothetical protein